MGGFLDNDTLLGTSTVSVCGFKRTRKSLYIAAFSVVAVIAGVGQSVGLPMWIAAFMTKNGPGATGAYFVVFFASAMFNVVFWPLACYQYAKGGISKETIRYTKSRKHYKLMLIGFCDAMNGILTVYASSNTRVPGSLQPILLQSTIPLTLTFSHFILGKRYVAKQIGGAALVILGILVSLFPVLYDLFSGTADTQLQSGWWWPLILIVGTVPGVLMNVLEEDVFEDEPTYNITLLIAFESLYQVLTVAAFFFTDIIPGFGTSTSFSSFISQVKGGFTCFFDPTALPDAPHCDYSAALGFQFALMYCLSYGCGSVLMKLASANYNGLVASVTNPVVVFFWIAVPAANKWAGGSAYTPEVIACDFAAVPVMMAGIVLFRMYEQDRLTRRSRSLTRRSVSSAHPWGEAAGEDISGKSPVQQALLGFAKVDYRKESAAARDRGDDRV